IRSVVPTEVPPYFCTMMGTLSGPPLAIRPSVAAASGGSGQPERVAEEPHLEQEQVLGHFRLARRVGDARERDHRVEPARLQQRLRQTKGVRDVDVVV